jgi:hypothetical protein
MANPVTEVVIEKTAKVPPSLSLTKRSSARVAFVNVKGTGHGVLSDCFRQFGVEPVIITGDVSERLQKEKFEACVVNLDSLAQPVLHSVRTSPSNSRMVIYGVGGNIQDAMRYSMYGINAIFEEPIERSTALKLVRATQMLVLHEFRRYARIPIITEVSVIAPGDGNFSARSQEISAGGMSLRGGGELVLGQSIEISFALLTLPRIWVRSTVSWRNPNSKAFGVRFDTQDERRLQIKKWIDSYLEY